MEQRTILVVEDEAVIGLEVSEILQTQGYKVPPVVMTSEDIANQVVTQKPDLILCDVRLGSFLDGIDAIQRVRLLNRDIPLVYMTAYGDEVTRKRAAKTGPVDILDKPVSREQLLSTVRKALNSGIA